jgi:membrane protein DedA with SNARE-associated domain
VNDLIATLKPYLDEYGIWAVFGVTLLENLGFPMPGQTMLMAGALLASRGKMAIAPLLLAAWAAAVTGGAIGYAIGRFGGRALVLRYGRYVWVTPKGLERVESFFRRHGGIVVVGARFVDVLRQLYGIVAGIAEMPWWRFLIYNTLGAALWVGFWGMLFYQLGERARDFGDLLKTLELLFLGGIAIAGVGLIIYLLRRRE